MSYYRYKFDPNSPAKKIVREDNDTYIMSDGTNVKKNLFNSLFVPVEGGVNENYSQPFNNNALKTTGLPVIHNAGMNIEDDAPIDPESFFSKGANQMNSIYQYELNQMNDPNHVNMINQKSKELGSVRLDENERQKLLHGSGGNVASNGQIIETNMNPAAYQSPYGSNTGPIQKSNLNPMAMDPMFADAKIEGVRPVQNTQHVNHQPAQQYEQPVQHYQQYNNPVAVQHPLFKKIKRKHPHNFVFKIEKMIADPDFIKIMDSNMEDSLVELFAEEFTNEVLSDRDAIKQMFIDELEFLVYGKKKPKPSKPKTSGKKTDTKNVVETPKVDLEQTQTVQAVVGDVTEPTQNSIIPIQADETEVEILDETPEPFVDPDICPETGKRWMPVDPKYAHLDLPRVYADDEDDNVRILDMGSGEEIDPTLMQK